MSGQPVSSLAATLDRGEPIELPHGPLLVASDASVASDAAFPMARMLAAHTGAAVQVISALRPNAMPTYAFDAMPYAAPPAPELLDRRAAQVASQLERLVPEASARAPWPVLVRTGDPTREIVSLAHEAEARLVVVGRGRHGFMERVLGGETVLRLLQLGETPVLAVEHTLECLPHRLVIATDFSLFSVYAAQVALEWAAPDAEVELVHVAPNLTDHAPVLRQFAEEYRLQADESFAAMIAQLERPLMRFTSTMLEGNASTKLVEHLQSHPADVVVTATHGYGFLRRIMLGSVAAALVRTAPCSVLCVPGSARTLAAARAQATAMHDHTHLLPLASLDAELSAFTARHLNRACSVEVNHRDIGAHSIGHHLPLAGISYEQAGAIITLMFGRSSDEGRHLAHQIGDVEQVEVVTDGAGREHVLRIRHAGGQTIVLLE